MPGANRIAGKFAELAANRQKGLITYVTAGDPDLDTTVQLAVAMEKAGADLIELGIPFSDPVADGPTIQKASCRALAKGVRVSQIVRTAARIRERSEVPLIFMTYYNPVLQYGLERFVRDSLRAGVDGLIVPDLPVEEAGPLLRAADSAGLALIPLAAPTTTENRLKKIAACARGFVYCVSITGVTGAREQIDTDLGLFTGRVREQISLPLAVGFGIAGPLQAARTAPFCDSVVVGSAIVNIVAEQGPAAVQAVARLTREIKSVLG
ncbi:MAG: tryptophan synthase subunit alpha [Bacillota bacterium]